MVLTAVVFNAFPDILDYFRKPVRTYVWMRVDKDVRMCTKCHQLVKDLADIAPLGRSGEEFTVGESTGSALTVAVIGIRVQDAVRGEFCHVHLAPFNVLSALQDNGFEPPLQELQGSEHSGGSGAYHNDRFRTMNILVWIHLERDEFFALPVCLDTVSVKYVLAGIDTASDYLNMAKIIKLDTKCFRGGSLKFCFRYFTADFHGYLELFHRAKNRPFWTPAQRPAGRAFRP